MRLADIIKEKKVGKYLFMDKRHVVTGIEITRFKMDGLIYDEYIKDTCSRRDVYINYVFIHDTEMLPWYNVEDFLEELEDL